MDKLASDIINAIRQEIDLNTILQKAVIRLGEFAQADRCAIWLYDEAKQQFDGLPAEYRRANLLTPITETSFPDLPALPALSKTETIVFSDAIQAVQCLTNQDKCIIQERQVAGLIHVPIVYHNKPLGLLRLHTVTPKQWDKEVVSTVQNIANQLAIAIHTAKLIEDLKDSESRKSAIMDASLDAIVTINRDGAVLEWNKGAERIFGYTYEQVIDKPMSDFIIPERYKRSHHQGIAHYLATGEGPVLGRRIELPAIRKDGTEFPTEISIVAIHQGEKVIFTATLRDISEQKEAQRALTRNESLLADFFENATLGLHWVGPDGTILRANRAELEMLGYEPHEYIGHHISEFHVDEPIIKDILTRLTGNETLIDYEARLRCKDGSIKDVLINSNVYIENEEFVHTRCFTRDITEQKRFEQELIESELRFRNLADTAPMYMAMADEIGNAIYFNKPWLEWTGRTMAEMEGLGWLCTLHPEDAPKFERDFKHAFQQQMPINEEYRFRRADGEYRWMMAVGAPRFALDGRFIGYFGTYTDFHELKEAQLALQESEAKFRSTFANAAIGIGITKPDGKLLEVNDAFCRIFGYSKEELQERDIASITHPDDLPGNKELLQQLILGDIPGFVIEKRYIKKDGSIVWSQTSVSITRDHEGNPVNLIGLAEDITERKKAEAALEESERQFRTLANSIAQLAWMAKPDGWIYWYNDRWFEYTGTTLEEMQGWGWQKVHHLDYVDRVTAFVQEGWLKDEPMELTFPLRGKDGEYRWFLTRAYPVKNAEGKVLRWIGTNTDIDEQKKTEEALKATEDRYRSVFGSSLIGALITDIDTGQVLETNDAFLNMLGYTREEFNANGISWQERTPPEYRELNEKARVEIKETGIANSFEKQYFRKDGSRVDVYLGCTLIKGTFDKSITFVLDITERKRAERAVAESEHRFRTMADASPFMVWMTDPDGQIIYHNQTTLNFTGFTLDETLQGVWLEAVHPDDVERAPERFISVLQSRQYYEDEFRLRRQQDGQYRWVLSMGTPRFNEEGEFLGYIGSAIDIHDRKEAEEKLKLSKENLEQYNALLASISRVQSRFITQEDPWVLFNDFLNDILTLTNSGYGYIGEVLYDENNQPYLKFRGLTNIAWNKETRELYDKYAESGLEFKKLNTLYGVGLTTGKTVISNDPYHDPRRGGLPADHPAMNSYIALPIFRGEQLIGQIGLANRTGGYDEALETFLQPVLITCGNLIEAYRNNELRKQSQDQLHKTLERESLLRRIVEVVNESQDITHILDTVAKELGQFLKADRTNIVRYACNTNQLQVALSAQFCASESIEAISMEDLDILVKAIQHVSPELLEETAEQVTYYQNTEEQREIFKKRFAQLNVTAFKPEDMLNLAQRYQIKSTLRSGIFYSGKPYGSISLHQCLELREWEPEEVGLVNVVADHIGIALYQEDLYQAEKQARQEAEEASRKKSEFLAMMSHELRTPLNSIIGYSRMIENGMGGPLTEHQAKYIKNVGSSGNHLLNIVNDLLDVSKVEAGKMVISPGLIEVLPIVNEVQSMMQELAQKSDVYVSFQVQPSIDTIEADPSRFKQILINLTSNAIKFNKVGGSVSVRLNISEDGEWLIGEVQDTGIGIAKEKQTELFKKFYQVDNTASRPHEGTGLGLALTKDLIELHGGEISLHSEEDIGSTFTFRLPTHSRVWQRLNSHEH